MQSQQDPFRTLVAFQVLHCPIPQLIGNTPHAHADEWPPAINLRTEAWKQRTDYLPKGGNQIYINVPFCPFYCHFCPAI